MINPIGFSGRRRSGRLRGAPVSQLCQIPAARARSRAATRALTPSSVRPPWCSRVSWPLRVSKTDSIHCRIPPSLPKRGLSSLRSGLIRWAPSQVGAEVLGDEPFEIFAGEAFVAQDDLAGADEMMVLFQQCLGHGTLQRHHHGLDAGRFHFGLMDCQLILIDVHNGSWPLANSTGPTFTLPPSLR